MASTDIVAYTGDAENLCPGCAAESVGWNGTGNPHQYLETAAADHGIDVTDEYSFDSSEWPKVIFDYQIEDTDEACAGCGERFIG